MMWDLWGLSLRLVMICSAISTPGQTSLRAPETAMMESIKSRGVEMSDRLLLNIVEQQVTRIEVSYYDYIPLRIFILLTKLQGAVTMLSLRNLIHPFKDSGPRPQANLMSDVLGVISAQLAEFKALKDRLGPTRTRLNR